MSATPARVLNKTITLDSSNETDIIECSTEDVYDKNNFFKTPRSHLKRKCNSAIKNEVISLKGFQFRNEIQQIKSPANDRLSNSLKCKLRSSFKIDDSVILDSSIISSSTPDRVKSSAKKNPVVNKLLSNIQKTPDLPYLSKSKLSRIEKWLGENDVETVKTPPFSNVTGTPVSLKKTPSTRKRPTAESDASSVDSEVKKVLVAVYGADWRNKNVLKKSKTEPKPSRNVISTTKTDVKTRAAGRGVTVRRVRRNIMQNDILSRCLLNDDKRDLDSSFSLGVKKLNDSISSVGTEKNSTRERRRRKKSSSSSGSWKPTSTRKRKKETEKKCTSHKSRTPRDEGKSVTSPTKTPVKTFLASLSVSTPKRRCHPEAQDFKINFKTKKEELAKKLFKLYNTEVFGNGLPEDMNFSWNIKLRGTAGYCYNKKIIKSTGQIIRLSRVEFSTKIIDRADRLRDTLIHELCHAASWVIDGVLDGHGSVWTKWAHKAMERFPELPAIKRCHNYEIASKYTYKCTGCGYSINRHSKSINIERKRCGYCFGVLQLFINKKKRGKGEVPEFDSTRTLPAPNNFALFVKENYQNVKSTKKDAKHAEIMKILSQKYALTKDAQGKTPSAKK
ncbi:UNVERIFIED_CONTAM: hypothetical protein PYX00_007155 [Menopon gallinae]|uniref:SprT-like domain-containing protein n=1 Tax=Menopon gallinae TaxID=328185 RepID=A0AAW2HI08_9NEOP